MRKLLFLLAFLSAGLSPHYDAGALNHTHADPVQYDDPGEGSGAAGLATIFSVDATSPSPSNLGTSITLNGTTVAARLSYDAANATTSTWTATTGPDLTGQGSGGEVSSETIFGASDKIAIMDGTRYWTGASAAGSIASDEDFVVEYLLRVSPGAAGYGGTKSNVGGPGITTFNNGADFRIIVENAAGVNVSCYVTGAVGRHYLHVLGFGDRDGSFWCFGNGASGTTSAMSSVTGAIEGTTPGVYLGLRGNSTIGDEGSGIVSFRMWAASAWLDTANQADFAKERFAQLMGLDDSEGAVPTFTSTGPLCASFNNNTLDCVSDDFPLVGSQIPAGMTGAGGGGGYQSVSTFTNSILYSDLDGAAWTGVGAGAKTCGQSDTPFNDGRTTCKIEDDSAAASERVYQYVTHGLSNGEVGHVQFWARSAASDSLYVELGERTGGGCSNPAVAGDTFALSTSWQQYSINYTLVDAVNCTQLILVFYPAGTAAAGGTGEANVTAVMMALGEDRDLPFYIETGASAVTAGDTVISYDGPSSVTTAGSYHVQLDYTPAFDDYDSSSYLFNMDTDADWLGVYTVSEALILQIDGNNAVVGTTNTPVVGTSETWLADIDTDADEYELTVAGSSEGTSSTNYDAPTSFSDFEIGHYITGYQADGWYDSITVTRD